MLARVAAAARAQYNCDVRGLSPLGRDCASGSDMPVERTDSSASTAPLEDALLPLVPLVYEDGWARGIVARRPLEVPVSTPPIVLGWPADPPERLRPFIENARAVARELRGADRNGGHIAAPSRRI